MHYLKQSFTFKLRHYRLIEEMDQKKARWQRTFHAHSLAESNVFVLIIEPG